MAAMRTIYLDYNATTPVAPAVRQAMLPFLTEHFGNPSSTHSLGRAAHEAVQDARTRVAALLGCRRDEIIFTSGGTEANNLAIKGVLFRHAPGGGGHVVISTLEHPAVVAPCRFMERLGYDVTVVPCNEQGLIDPQAVAQALRNDTVLVSIMHANNEIGTIQPVAEIARLCHQRGVLVHTDAAQTAGKLPVVVDNLGVDLLTLAGHKMYAPKGVGALYVRRGTDLEPLLHGAGHELGLRAGTENVPYLIGLGEAATLAAAGTSEKREQMLGLRDRLLARLRQAIGPWLLLHAEEAPRLPNTLSVNFPGVQGAELLRRCPEVCASTGSACHAEATHLSPTLAALGLPPQFARGTVRLSLGWHTSEEEIDRASNALISAWEGLHA